MRKRIVGLFVTLAMLAALLPCLPVLADSTSLFAGGDGSEENPYQISTPEQFNSVRNDLTKHYILTNDISLSSYKSWMPIGGNGTGEFTGVLDGNNHTISDLTITNNNLTEIGLFGLCKDNSVLKNMTLNNVDIKIHGVDDYIYVGSISGNCNIAMNVSVQGSIRMTNCVSGAVGGVTGNGTVTQSVNNVELSILEDDKNSNSGSFGVGGISGGGAVNDNVNYADININAGSTLYCGGIAGGGAGSNNVNYGTINAVTKDTIMCGGIIGHCGSDIENCINYGNIAGSVSSPEGWSSAHDHSDVGGIVGFAWSSVYNSANVGNITAYANPTNESAIQSTASAGGIAGQVGEYHSKTESLENCYNAGNDILAYRNNNKYSNLDKYFTVGRICGHGNVTLKNNVSISKTTVNGNIPTEQLGYNEINGETENYDTVMDKINSLLRTIEQSIGQSTIQDSQVTSTVEATMSPQTAETISDETILKAKILHNNGQFRYYSNAFRSPAVILNNEINKVQGKAAASAYLVFDDMVTILTLGLEDYFENLNTEKYYETVLTDIIENDTEGVWDAVYSSWKSTTEAYNNKVLQEILGEAKDLDKIKNSDLWKNNTLTVFSEKVKDYSSGKGVITDLTVDFNALDQLSLGIDLAGDFIDAIDEVIAYTAVQQEKIDLLKDLQNKTGNPYLKTACGNLIEDIKYAHENALKYFLENGGKDAAEDLVEFSHGLVVSLVLKYISTDTAGVAPYAPGVSEAITILKGGKLVSNGLFKADDVSKNVLTISAYASIEEEILKILKRTDKAFDKNMTLENSKELIAYADFMKASYLQSCKLVKGHTETLKKANRNMRIAESLGDVLSGNVFAFTDKSIEYYGASDYDEMIELMDFYIKHIKAADFYSLEAKDVIDYLREIVSKTPSDWAKPFVDKAISYNILHDNMQNNYQNNITRAEFCVLMTNAIENFTGENIDDYVERFDYKTDLFKDTYYEFIYYMARMGIVYGVSDTEFNPLGEITRQEAATMLMRAARAVGQDVSAPDTNLDGVADWAKEGVNFVVANDIMTGTDNGFEPQGTYTKEQAITTMVRFYENLR